MNARCWLLAFGLGLILADAALAQTSQSERIAALVRKLGSSSYAQREQAKKELEAIGTPALAGLRKAAANADVETSRRLAELIRRCEEQLVTQQILSPKEVHLKLKDATVQQAIAELANISGYPIQFFGDATLFADKRITIDARMPFWRAFDHVCEQGGLMERVDPPQPGSPMYQAFGKAKKMRLVAPMPAPERGPIVVVPRSEEKSAVIYAGAVKTELRVTRDKPAKELVLQFIVSPEPRLQNASVVGKPALERVVDGKSAHLAIAFEQPKPEPKPAAADDMWADVVLEWGPQGQQRVATIRVKEGPNPGRQLKELIGSVTLQVEMQNEIIAKIDNVLEAAGKSAAGANGGSLRLESIDKRANGSIEMQITMNDLTPNPYANNVFFGGGGGIVIRGGGAIAINGRMIVGPNGVVINGNGNQQETPDLVDAKGEKFRAGVVLSESTSINNTNVARSLRVLFQPNTTQAAPRDLVLFGTRTHSIGVPFRFENVPLPP
jgi:hypothetical protein